MNDAQHAALQTYVRAIADQLLLRDWEIIVSRDHTDGDDPALADIAVLAVEDYATVRVNVGFFVQTPTRQRETVIHELIHAHTDRVKRVWNQINEQVKDNDLLTFGWELQRRELEILVQKLARILAPTLPLPDLPPGVHY